MKAIILAAGKGARMSPLGITTPKLLIPIFNRPTIHWYIDTLKDFVEEVIFIIDNGDFGSIIKEYIETRTWPINVRFAIQIEAKGTGHAVQSAESLINKYSKLIIMNGDDLYSKRDIENVLKYNYSVLGKRVNDPEKWGILRSDEEGNLLQLIEKPKEFVGDIANTGLYHLDSKIFDYYDQIKESIRGEYEFTDVATLFAKDQKVKVLPVEDYWIPIGYPWHILEAHETLINRIEFIHEGQIQDNVAIHGRIKIGKGSVIKSGTYIEGDVIIGENCIIGPNAYIRGISVIGDNCKIGNAVEIKNSTIFNNTNIPQLSYVGDSIIGSEVNIAGGFKVANRRHDGTNVKTLIKGQLVDTGRKKFGTVIGNDTKLGINTLVYPGRKIGPNQTTLPGETIKEDKL